MITYSGSKEYTQQELLELMEFIKAIIYVRVSTADQVNNYSIDSQIERCVNQGKQKFEYTEDEMMVIVEPGESGDDPDRPALNHVLFLLENGVGRKLIVLHPNRLSRYLALQTMVSQRIWQVGCDLDFVEFEVDPDNPESMLMYNIQGSIAQYNKAKILADTDRGRKQMIKNNKIPGLRRMYGYTFDKELDTLVENPEEKNIYQLIVQWIRKGKDGQVMKPAGIAEELALQGVPGPDGGIWYASTIVRILRNPAYMGRYFYGKTKIIQNRGKRRQVKQPREKWYSVTIPAYIDEETFNEVQAILDGNTKKGRGPRTENYLLKGLVRCGRCGAAVGGAPYTRTKNKILYYYGCTAKTRKAFKVGSGEAVNVCRGRNWRQDTVDEQVWEFLIERLKDPDRVISDVVKQQQDVKKLEELERKKSTFEKRLKDKNDERKNLLQLFARGRIRSDAELDELLQPVDQQIDHLEQELSIVSEALRNASMTIDELELVKKSLEEFRQIVHFDDFSFKAKRMLVERFIFKVILGEDTIEIITKWHATPSGPTSQRASNYG